MNSSIILILYLLFFALEFIFERLLEYLNLKKVQDNRDALPVHFRDLIDDQDYFKSVSYTLAKGKFSFFEAAVTSIILLAVILSGSLGYVDQFLDGLGLHPYLHGLLFIGSLTLFFHLLELPLSIYSHFVIEEEYGFNKMNLFLYLVDQLKGLLLSFVMGGILLTGIFFFMDLTGVFWWVWASAFTVLFQLLIIVIYPHLIAPFFNKFQPLEDGELKDRLTALAKKLKFKAGGIYVMDGSRRSGHSNAYFAGIGNSKRIVLYDTLMNDLTIDQLEAVLAHEIGHEKKHHVIRQMTLSIASLVTAFFVLALFIDYLPVYEAFGFSHVSMHGIMVILGFCATPFTFFLNPLFSVLSRRYEYQADGFAVKALGSRDSLKSALSTMERKNLSNLIPHKLYSFYHYSHPTLAERLEAIEEIDIHISSDC